MRIELVPNAVTLLRPALGVGAAIAAIAGEGALAAWLFLAGYLSDVVDGWLARSLAVTSEQGRRLDQRADMAFHVTTGLGLVLGAAMTGDWWVIAVVAVLLVGRQVSRGWAVSRSVISKSAAGVYWATVYTLFVVQAGPGSRPPLIFAGILVLVVTYTYEASVMHRELRTGERTVR